MCPNSKPSPPLHRKKLHHRPVESSELFPQAWGKSSEDSTGLWCSFLRWSGGLGLLFGHISRTALSRGFALFLRVHEIGTQRKRPRTYRGLLATRMFSFRATSFPR